MDFRGKQFDIVGKWKLWFSISAFVIIVGMISWAAFGLNQGIDFKGGGQLKYLIPQDDRPAGGDEVALIEKTRNALGAKGIDNARIQVSGGDTLIIVTQATDSNALNSQVAIISDTLQEQFGESPQLLGQEMVGPVIGRELRANAIKGVVIGICLIALWIYIRYNFAGAGLRYAVAGIVALLHDVLVLLGMFALIGRFYPSIEVDGAFIAALLTVVGYSINDSVVIFDRIRENQHKRRRDPFPEVVNDSLLETMSRSINTGLTVLIMMFALLWFGGESIYSFMLAMLIGVATGLYSSIFNASMVLIAWHHFEMGQKEKASTRKVERVATPERKLASANGAPADREPKKEVVEPMEQSTDKMPPPPRKSRAKRRF